VSVSGSNVQIALSAPVDHNDTIELDYNRAAGRAIVDLAGNMALSLADIPIVNATDNTSFPRRVTNVVRVTSIARIVDPTKRITGLGGGGV
jgi:predicted GTPase